MYSHLGEKLLRTTYNALGVKLTGTLQVCDGYERSKAKTRAVRNKTYRRASQPGERIFVDTTGPFSESLIWESVLDWRSRQLQPLLLEFLHKNQVATAKEGGTDFRKDYVT